MICIKISFIYFWYLRNVNIQNEVTKILSITHILGGILPNNLGNATPKIYGIVLTG